MSQVKLLTMGELLIDMFPAEIGRRLAQVQAFYPKPGGAPANVAVAASRLGVKSGFIGKVGQDHFGEHLEAVLRAEGVDTSGLSFDAEARTTMAIIAMPDEQSAEFVFYRNPGADQRIAIDDLDDKHIAQAGALHVGSISLTDEPARSATFHAVDIARRAGGLVSYDVNYRPSLWHEPAQAISQARRMITEVDLVKVNEREAGMLVGTDRLDPTAGEQLASAADQLLAMGPKMVVITLGAGGCYYRTEAASGLVPGFSVEASDAIGCGDAFMAGLLVGLIEAGQWPFKLTEEKVAPMLRFANAAGALTSTKRGAMPALPYRADVDEFLSAQN